jgi:hypothetical protein
VEKKHMHRTAVGDFKFEFERFLWHWLEEWNKCTDEISGSHCDEYEDVSLMGFCAV